MSRKTPFERVEGRLVEPVTLCPQPSSPDEAWQLINARELAEDLDSRDYFDAGFEAGKHCPSGDVQRLREALTACIAAVREYGGHGTPTVDRAEWAIAHNMADAALASVPAGKAEEITIGVSKEVQFEPQVDAKLEQIANTLLDMAENREGTRYRIELKELADAIRAHARKSQLEAMIIEVSGLTPKLREVLTASVKWLDRISERRADLPASFLDNCNPEPLANQIRQLLTARSQPKEGDQVKGFANAIRSIIAEEPCDNDGRGCPTIGRLEQLITVHESRAAESQPKEGVNQRLLKAARDLLGAHVWGARGWSKTGHLSICSCQGGPPSECAVCGKTVRMMEAIRAAESAAPGMEKGDLKAAAEEIVHTLKHPLSTPDIDRVLFILERRFARKEAAK